MVSLKWNFHNLIRILQTWNCFYVISVSLLEIDDELIRRFTDAACDGDVSLVNEWLDDGVPVDSEYGFDGTALRYAAWKNRTDVTQSLLEGGEQTWINEVVFFIQQPYTRLHGATALTSLNYFWSMVLQQT